MTLRIDDLAKSYGDRAVLRGVSFAVGLGEIFGFVGSNGAGKTTTMRIALGLLEPDGGTVAWRERPIDTEVRRTIGYMPEERGLYPKMKVGEQLIYLGRLHGMSKPDAAVAMAHWTEKLGVSERVDDEVAKLSLGNQQRVQLAAALLHEPDVLILDEPFSGLDPIAVEVMSGVLRERAAAGVPVLFSSHQLDLVERLCDRVGIIKDGRMVAVGGLDDLRRPERPRWLVRGAPAQDWTHEVAGARVLSADDGRTVVEIEEGQDQALLAAALRVGPVTEFSPQYPSLTELYRGVVSQQEAA